MRSCSWGNVGYTLNQSKRKTNILFVSLIVASLLIFCAGLHVRYAPPGQGTICKKGSHQAVYDMYNHVEGDNIAYYLCIASDDGKTWWTWYVNPNTYERYEVGDRVGFLGLQIGGAEW